MVAATAIRLDAKFATIDLDDFRRFRAAGLRLVDENGMLANSYADAESRERLGTPGGSRRTRLPAEI